MQNRAAVELEERIRALAARIHAATEELVDLSAELDDGGAWSGIGMRSCAHWLSINIGVDLWVGGDGSGGPRAEELARSPCGLR